MLQLHECFFQGKTLNSPNNETDPSLDSIDPPYKGIKSTLGTLSLP